jgi:hypothetical protein
VAAAITAIVVSLRRDADGRLAALRHGAAAMADALARTLEAAPQRTRPKRCALASPQGPATLEAGKRTFRRRGDELVAEGRGQVVMGIVADARGAAAETLRRARRVREAFARAGVQVVVSLGGMGESKEELEEILGALADRRWLLAALPGDREPLADHAEAIRQLQARGLPAVDAAALRVLRVGEVALAPFPGVALDGHGLVAGPDGCARGAEELARLPEAEVLLAHAPPRQAGAHATDLARGGIHVGDPWVTQAADRTKARLVVHGLIDETAGRTAEEGERLVAATGALEGTSRGAVALIVELEEGRAHVRAVEAAPSP